MTSLRRAYPAAFVALAAAVAVLSALPAGAQPPERSPMAFDAAAACGTEPPLPAYPSACPPPGRPPLAPGVCHPYPQPRPRPSCQRTTGCPGDCYTEVDTGPGVFPPANPFAFETFPGTNFLPNVYTNAFDGAGNEIPNTLPSTPDVPYNLHDGEPVVREINPLSPEDDLERLFDTVLALATEIERLDRGGAETAGAAAEIPPSALPGAEEPAAVREAFSQGEIAFDRQAIRELIALGLDVLEGEPVPNRAYSGFPLLHYTSPEKVRTVEPVYDGAGRVVGGNVDVHQIWYGQHIESDTAYLDPTPILYDEQGNRRKGADGEDLNVSWTVTYKVDVLARGHDDFSPFVAYFDPYAPGGKKPGVGMDQSFFPMDDGTRTVLKIKMAPAVYLNLIYTWGWRMHPPRIQVMESAVDPISYGGKPHPECPAEYEGWTRPQIERAVFCPPSEPHCTSVRCAAGEPRFVDGEPTACERRKLHAIGRIGELSPAKRMWRALRRARAAAARDDDREVARIVREEAVPAFRDWQDRTRLPAGVEEDPESDITILYVNNTIYGELTNGAIVRWNAWEERPATLRVTAYNGDTFPHAYDVADFGGNRGWENQFKSSVKVAGSGCWFTFGRVHWWLPAGGPNGYLCVPPTGVSSGVSTGEGAPGKHRFAITLNYDPSRRLRFYQFDPFHHDVAIFSVH